MTVITRKDLIKAIVAEEMINLQTATEYNQILRDQYKIWEHKSSEELCNKYNKIKDTKVQVEHLSREA